MREKAGVVVIPVLRNADGGIIEVGAWRGIESESRPEANQDQHERDHLRSHAREAEQEEEDVAQADLGERVLECEVGLIGPERSQEDAQEDQNESATDRVSQHLSEGFALHLSGRDRKGQCRADQERKGGLNEVVQRAALPFHVLGVVGDERPNRAVRKGPRHFGQMRAFVQHQHHDQPAEGIQREYALEALRLRSGCVTADSVTALSSCRASTIRTPGFVGSPIPLLANAARSGAPRLRLSGESC